MQSESHFWQASLHSDVLYVIFRHGKLLKQLLLKKEEGGETENGKVVSYCSVKPLQLTISFLLTDDNHHLVLKEPAYQFPLPSASKDRFHFFSCWLTILTVTAAICQANGNVNFRKTDKRENNKLFTHKKRETRLKLDSGQTFPRISQLGFSDSWKDGETQKQIMSTPSMGGGGFVCEKNSF